MKTGKTRQSAVAASSGRAEMAGIKPIKGTWLVLLYSDVRDKYYAPKGNKFNTAENWRTKIKELAGLGMEYLIISAVAESGRACYESDWMPPAYEGQESPVSAIMKTADEHGMKVFMGFGWITTTAECGISTLANPAHMQTTFRIMRELVRKFGGHKSFYGWYLSYEDGIGAHFQDEAIRLYNTVSAEGRRLMPGAKILMSPYGLPGVTIDHKFVEQLAKLDVDIMAYQDSVGSVGGAWPMDMKTCFSQLRAAHDQVPQIALWANVESFTWEIGGEKDGTVCWLPLAPAALPRILKQMADVTPFVDEIVSYIILGMMDKPGSPVPLGQPVLSAKLAENYLDFLAGRDRWPLLAASFTGKLTHDALHKPVTLAYQPSFKYSRGNLTNGAFGTVEAEDWEWLGFEWGDLNAIIDMGQSVPIRTLAARFLQCERKGIRLPSEVVFALSDDGQNFKTVASIIPERWSHDRQDYWIDMVVTGELKEKARYVRVQAANAAPWRPGNFLFVDELLVNPRVVDVTSR